jgi:WD40 repeat protein
MKLPMGEAHLRFTPDGRWLVSGSADAYRFWHVGTWRPGLVIRRVGGSIGPGPMAFTPDGRILAMVRRHGQVGLVDTRSGEEIARLTAPNELPISWLCFSSDGSQLAVATEKQAIQIWDLRAIRRQLARIGLDWGLPPYPPA